ncbi:MAG TPA: hypothetical protein VMI32_16860 [Candidatus Solibacter sp.]|nr:hypothetical protein [Candidatus Solibacter sp.]
MPERLWKLSLSENHRRVVSAVVRRVETTCDEVLGWLERTGGDLHALKEDVAPKQAEEIRALVRRLREETRRVQNELVIDPSVQSRARGIVASVSLTRTEIEEILTPGLRGYGALAPETEAALDKQFSRILVFLQAMGEIAQRCSSRGAP